MTKIVNMTGHGKIFGDSRKEDQDAAAQKIFDSTGLPSIMLITVQHTGTRFFTKILEGAGYRLAWPLHQPGRPLYSDHCRAQYMDNIKARLSEGTILITTIRNWDDCEASWRRREVSTIEEFKEQREIWEDFIIDNAEFTLSIDHVRKEELLRSFGEYLGVPLETDWRPIV